MKKSNHKGKILQDHKKVGQKLIPPLMQLVNMKEVSFQKDTLPCLIWMSAIFLRNKDQKAVHNIVDFLTKCADFSEEDESFNFALFNDFNKLNFAEKQRIINVLSLDLLSFMRKSLEHQYLLFNNYPLAFIFDGYTCKVDKERAIELLKEDVSSLLNRYSMHSTKVQTTVVYSMALAGKIVLSSNIDIPNFNSIFIEPESLESQKVASFVRSILNLGNLCNEDNSWSKLFWQQCFDMEGCS